MRSAALLLLAALACVLAGTPPPTPPTPPTTVSPTPSVATCAYDAAAHACFGTCAVSGEACTRSGPTDCVCVARGAPMPLLAVLSIAIGFGVLALLCCVSVLGGGQRRVRA